MDTKEIIEWIENCMDENLSEEYDNKKMKNIIKLLQRGEKYEEMWEEFEFYIGQCSEALINKMHLLEQKYFPKGGSQC